MIEETNEELQVQLDDQQEATESVEILEGTQEASTDSGGDDELDKYTRGVSKRINKLNERTLANANAAGRWQAIRKHTHHADDAPAALRPNERRA